MTRLQLSLQFCSMFALFSTLLNPASAQDTPDVAEYARCLAKAEQAWKTHKPALAWEELENCPTQHRGWEWHFLRQNVTRMRELGEHKGQVVDIAFTGNGQQVRAITHDGVEQAWNLANGQEARTQQLIGTPLGIHEHGNETRMVLTANGKIFYHTDKLQGARQLGACTEADSCRVAFSEDGKRVAVTADWKSIQVCDTASGKQVRSFTKDDAAFVAVALSPDGKHLAASSSKHHQCFVWNVETGVLLATRDEGFAYQLVYSPKGDVLASPRDGKIRLYETTEYQLIATLEGHAARAAVAFRGDGKVLASAGQDQQVKFWDVAAARETGALPVGMPLSKVAFSPDGTRVAVTTTAGRLLVLEPGTALPTTSLSNRPAGWIRSLAVHPAGGKMATAENDGSITLWDISRAEPEHQLKGHEGSARSLAYSPDGARLVSAGADGTLRVWDTAQATELLMIKAHQRIIRSVSYASDGKRIASAGDDGVIRIWDSETGMELLRLDNRGRGVFSVTFSREGSTIAAAVAGGDIQLWDLSKQAVACTCHGHSDIANCVVFSPDGKQLASASNDRTVRVWDITGKLVHTLRGHDANVQCVTFSPDGKRLTSAGWDKCVRFWDAQSGKMVFHLEGGAMINSIAYGPRGHYLAIAGFDRQPCIWNAPPQ